MFTGVCLSTVGGYYPSMHCRWYPSMPCSRSPGPHQRGKWRGIWSRPTTKGKLRGIWSRPTPWGGALRGIWSRPTPKGEVEGDLPGECLVLVGACSGGCLVPGGAWSWGCLVETSQPPQMAIATGGMHPTGMHSCSNYNSLEQGKVVYLSELFMFVSKSLNYVV